MMKKLREAPASSHISEEIRRLNPHLYGGPIAASQQKAKSPELAKPRGRKAMNKTEMAFTRILDAMKSRGDIARYDREGLTLRWDDGMTYTPDFACYAANGRVTLIEVKGAWIEGDALVKFRAARANWEMFEFQLWQNKKSEWTKLL